MGFICPLTRLFSHKLTVVSSSGAPPSSAHRLEEKPPVRCGLVKEGECLLPRDMLIYLLKRHHSAFVKVKHN